MAKRVQIILLTSLFVALGVPVWWHTTAVHRAPLPVDNVRSWSESQAWPLFRKLFAEYPPGFAEKVMKASPGYRLSFTLANADPKSILPVWDFSIIERYLKPLLDKLSVIADFTVESQYFHYAALLHTPQYNTEFATFSIPEDQITQYINPHDWKPDFSATMLPTINFIIYIPSKAISPLKLRHTNGTYSPTNTIKLPQWGGITILNPKKNSQNNESEPQPQIIRLGCGELSDVAPVIAAQLNELLGARYSPTLTDKDLDVLVKRRLSENVKTAAHTLLSLANLVDSLPNIVVLDHISDLVGYSVSRLNVAHDLLEKGDYVSSLRASREALVASERAFFDPSMLALLYFPDEHKYAIYTPLFLPVCFPILSAMVSEFKHRKAAKKAQKEKEETQKLHHTKQHQHLADLYLSKDFALKEEKKISTKFSVPCRSDLNLCGLEKKSSELCLLISSLLEVDPNKRASLDEENIFRKVFTSEFIRHKK